MKKKNCRRKLLLSHETLEQKDLKLYATNLTEKIADLRNAKEDYQSFLRKKVVETFKSSYSTTKTYKDLKHY